jgi:glycolate oxidase
MQCYGLAAGGQAGIVRMLELLEDEVIRSMGLLGATSYAKLDSSMLHVAAATNVPGVFSAFPHLEIAPYCY